MDTKIFNKIDTSQLTKIDTNLQVHKENNNLTDQIKEDLKPVDEEPYTPPCIHPAVHNYIKLNQFDVRFDEPCFIQPDNVLSVTKPLYNVRKEKYVSNKVMLAFEVIHAVHYFGKPSRYDNFYTDDDVIKMVHDFNDAKHSYMEVFEYDQNGAAKIKTTYTAPRIYRLDFATFDKKDENKKYYIAEVHFNNMTQEPVLYTEEESEER